MVTWRTLNRNNDGRRWGYLGGWRRLERHAPRRAQMEGRTRLSTGTIAAWSPDGAAAVAPAPLHAALAFALNTDPGRGFADAISSVRGCVVLCESPTIPVGGDPWYLQAHAVGQWRFTAPDGHVESPGVTAGGLDELMQLAVSWDGGWRVSASYQGQMGDGCRVLLATVAAHFPGADGSGGYNGSANPADGCAMTVTHMDAASQNGSGPPPPAKRLGVLLYRFGVLLAVDDDAHAAEPQLPVASAHERALAQQWLPQQ